MMILLLLNTAPAWAENADSQRPDAMHSTARDGFSQGMPALRIILSKLTETVKANKDLDGLESLGMPGPEVARLKQALQMKAKQLTDDALDAIQAL